MSSPVALLASGESSWPTSRRRVSASGQCPARNNALAHIKLSVGPRGVPAVAVAMRRSRGSMVARVRQAQGWTGVLTDRANGAPHASVVRVRRPPCAERLWSRSSTASGPSAAGDAGNVRTRCCTAHSACSGSTALCYAPRTGHTPTSSKAATSASPSVAVPAFLRWISLSQGGDCHHQNRS